MKKKLTKVIDSLPMSGFMHQSIPGAPRQQQRIICPPRQSRGWGMAHFGWPGGRAFAKPGTIPKLVARACIPVQT